MPEYSIIISVMLTKCASQESSCAEVYFFCDRKKLESEFISFFAAAH